MENSSDNPNEEETPPNRDPSAPLPVPNSGSGVIFRRRPTTGRLSTDSGTSDAEDSPSRRRNSSTEDGGSPRRISVGAESGYGSPFAPSTSSGQTYFNFAFSPPLMSGVHQPDMARFSVPRPPPEQGRRRASSEASTFRSIGTQTLTGDFGLRRDEDEVDDDDDNISLGSYADDAFYEDEEQEALGMVASGGPLPDVIPEVHDLNLPNGRRARLRNRAHSVSFPIDQPDPEDLGRCLRRIAQDFDQTSIAPVAAEDNRQDEMVNEVPEETLPIPTGNPEQTGFFAFLRSSIGSRRRQRSLSASEVLSSIWAASQPEPPERRASEAPSMASASSTPTQTPRYNNRHPDKFL